MAWLRSRLSGSSRMAWLRSRLSGSSTVLAPYGESMLNGSFVNPAGETSRPMSRARLPASPALEIDDGMAAVAVPTITALTSGANWKPASPFSSAPRVAAAMMAPVTTSVVDSSRSLWMAPAAGPSRASSTEFHGLKASAILMLVRYQTAMTEKYCAFDSSRVEAMVPPLSTPATMVMRWTARPASMMSAIKFLLPRPWHWLMVCSRKISPVAPNTGRVMWAPSLLLSSRLSRLSLTPPMLTPPAALDATKAATATSVAMARDSSTGMSAVGGARAGDFEREAERAGIVASRSGCVRGDVDWL